MEDEQVQECRDSRLDPTVTTNNGALGVSRRQATPLSGFVQVVGQERNAGLVETAEGQWIPGKQAQMWWDGMVEVQAEVHGEETVQDSLFPQSYTCSEPLRIRTQSLAALGDS
ncbi:hypothetical protein CTAM01_06564 [Colletotrichum tamarilloi]|uniref:Uncharacterized protein n=1 Tax=Colletotrichum tamarilloi TaxID=1209934 RepID=A0ABQ9RBU5_9PEZI|nr:uncharacterized protein CTAM01_06564 [Colletotrichum tamarilloi]KAK1500629.1 hypothetical protein CTAM01_06564 [Colletotrichum tamarilloi]